MREPAYDAPAYRLLRRWHSPVRRRLMQFTWWLRGLGLSKHIRCLQPGSSDRRSLGENEFSVFTTFRDGALYLDSFIQHYQTLGAAQIILLDNGSTDGSREIVERYPEVCLLYTELEYKKYNVAFRHYLRRRYAGLGWAVAVDIDELLDYPGSKQISMGQFLEYLNAHDFDSVQGYMLDRFGQKPLGEAGSFPSDVLSEKYPYYDLENIYRRGYTDTDRGPLGLLSNPAIEDYYGGVRYRLYGVDEPLSKFPILKARRRAMYGVHRVYNSKVADVSVVLNHYRFLDNLVAVAKNFRASGKDRYGALLDKVELGEKIQPYHAEVKVWQSADALVEEGFLVAGDSYRSWMEEHKAGLV